MYEDCIIDENSSQIVEKNVRICVGVKDRPRFSHSLGWANGLGGHSQHRHCHHNYRDSGLAFIWVLPLELEFYPILRNGIIVSLSIVDFFVLVFVSPRISLSVSFCIFLSFPHYLSLLLFVSVLNHFLSLSLLPILLPSSS